MASASVSTPTSAHCSTPATSNRRVNRHGHFFTSNIDLSPVLSTAEIEYYIPLEDPLSDFLTFSGGLKREHTDTYRSLSALLSTRWKHAYESGWKQTAFLDYVYENYTAESDSGDTLMLVPGGSWLISVADNPLRPQQRLSAGTGSQRQLRNPAGFRCQFPAGLFDRHLVAQI